MSEVFKVPANLLIALIVLAILLFFIFISLGQAAGEERVYIGRNGCITIGTYIFNALQFGGILSGITTTGINILCNLLPF
jgi:hypothetical protein